MIKYRQFGGDILKSVGIICEYNPFHNGHVYHIEKVKKLFPDYVIVLIMSGNFTQRGEVSMINKWDKTDIALNYVDLVIELPFVFASQSADVFARGSCDILKFLDVDALVFGSECNNIERLKNLVSVQEDDKYDELVKKYLEQGFNYPTSLSKALVKLGGDTIQSPNDLLGLCYLKELKNSNVEVCSIKRTNDYLDDNLSETISSGLSIREAIKKGTDVSKFVPSCSYKYLNDCVFLDDYFDLIKYRIICDDISIYQSVDEGIHNKLKKNIAKASSIDDLIMSVKSKRYTYNKIRRMLTHILTGFTKEEASHIKTSYIRVLGFNRKGQKFLNSVKKKCEISIITTYKNDYLLDIESRVSKIYNLKKKSDTLDEHEHKPIIR